MRPSKRCAVRIGSRTLVSLAFCAAVAAAVIAHIAIDVLGDYALTADSYDNLRHGSRELASFIAFILAVTLAVRGLRICCEIAAANRTRILLPVNRLRDWIGFVLAAGAAAVVLGRAVIVVAALGLQGTETRADTWDDCIGAALDKWFGTPAAPTLVNQRFSDTYSYGDLKVQLVYSCYLIKHGDDYLLWDAGHAMTTPNVAPKGI